MDLSADSSGVRGGMASGIQTGFGASGAVRVVYNRGMRELCTECGVPVSGATGDTGEYGICRLDGYRGGEYAGDRDLLLRGSGDGDEAVLRWDDTGGDSGTGNDVIYNLPCTMYN